MQAGPLSSAAAQLERAAKARQVAAIDELVREVSDKLQAVNAQLRETG
jgi:hypothetical protein